MKSELNYLAINALKRIIKNQANGHCVIKIEDIENMEDYALLLEEIEDKNDPMEIYALFSVITNEEYEKLNTKTTSSIN